ncbi:MAG: hypothetical protein ACLP3B_06810 [Syntrophobacteraceae bacterium]
MDLANSLRCNMNDPCEVADFTVNAFAAPTWLLEKVRKAGTGQERRLLGETDGPLVLSGLSTVCDSARARFKTGIEELTICSLKERSFPMFHKLTRTEEEAMALYRRVRDAIRKFV